jgi:PBSX family phage terminase large subunit
MLQQRTRTYLDLLSPKQERYLYGADAFLNIAEGAVRSGKTFDHQLLLTIFAEEGPPGTFFIMGKTRQTAERNVIYPLISMYPEEIRYNRGLGELRIRDRKFDVLGANDAQAFTKIMGSTAAGAYLNEGTLFPEDVLKTLVDRCSIDGAQIFLDTNPDSPYHWLYQNWLTDPDKAEYLRSVHFELDDNPSLSEAYKERLKKMHSGVWYERMVLGRWRMAEGVIYDMWDEDVHVVTEMPGRPDRVVVGIDYGTQNATCYLAFGRVGNDWYAFDEYYHSGEKTGKQKTDQEYSADLIAFVEGMGYAPNKILIDPSAASFKTQLRKDGVARLRDADNSVLDGIRNVASALTRARNNQPNGLYVLRRCENLREQKTAYVWDVDAAKEKGKEQPLEGVEDHAMDAERYAARHIFGRADLQVVGKPVGA